MSKSKVEDTWAELQKSGEYPDIEALRSLERRRLLLLDAPDLDRTFAESLAEYRSVERLSNV